MGFAQPVLALPFGLHFLDHLSHVPGVREVRSVHGKGACAHRSPRHLTERAGSARDGSRRPCPLSQASTWAARSPFAVPRAVAAPSPPGGEPRSETAAAGRRTRAPAAELAPSQRARGERTARGKRRGGRGGRRRSRHGRARGRWRTGNTDGGHHRDQVHDIGLRGTPRRPHCEGGDDREEERVEDCGQDDRGHGQPRLPEGRPVQEHRRAAGIVAEPRARGEPPGDAGGHHRVRVGSVTIPSFSMPERRTRSMVSTTNPY